MAQTDHYYTQFEEAKFYHVYNRSIDRMPMFKSDDNYSFFLKKYDHYLSDVLDTYAYCLLGNHFHLLIRVHDEITIRKFIEQPGQDLTRSGREQDLTTFEKLSNLNEAKTTHDIISHQFRKFFQSYAMAFNKQNNRTGTLFQTPFKRSLVDADSYFTQLIYYIHANPQHHGLIDDFREWKWSSYGRMLVDKPTKLKKQEVIGWFENADLCQKYHSEKHQEIRNYKFIIEDDI